MFHEMSDDRVYCTTTVVAEGRVTEVRMKTMVHSVYSCSCCGLDLKKQSLVNRKNDVHIYDFSANR